MPLESTGTTDFDKCDFPYADSLLDESRKRRWPTTQAGPVSSSLALALEEIDRLQRPINGLREIFKKHRASIEAAASHKFDRRGEDEMYEGMPVVRVFSDDLPSPLGARGRSRPSARCWSAPCHVRIYASRHA